MQGDGDIAVNRTELNPGKLSEAQSEQGVALTTSTCEMTGLTVEGQRKVPQSTYSVFITSCTFSTERSSEILICQKAAG